MLNLQYSNSTCYLFCILFARVHFIFKIALTLSLITLHLLCFYWSYTYKVGTSPCLKDWKMKDCTTVKDQDVGIFLCSWRIFFQSQRICFEPSCINTSNGNKAVNCWKRLFKLKAMGNIWNTDHEKFLKKQIQRGKKYKNYFIS